MTELVMGVIILALIGFIAWREKETRHERRELMTGALTKDPVEYRIAATTPTKEEKPQAPAEFMPTTEMSDEEFFEAIKKSNEDAGVN